MKDTFEQFDTSGDGEVSLSELGGLVASLGVASSSSSGKESLSLTELLKSLDTDGNGAITHVRRVLLHDGHDNGTA